MTLLLRIVIWIGLLLVVVGMVLSLAPFGPEAVARPGSQIEGVPRFTPLAALSFGLLMIAVGVLGRMAQGFVRQRRRAPR